MRAGWSPGRFFQTSPYAGGGGAERRRGSDSEGEGRSVGVATKQDIRDAEERIYARVEAMLLRYLAVAVVVILTAIGVAMAVIPAID